MPQCFCGWHLVAYSYSKGQLRVHCLWAKACPPRWFTSPYSWYCSSQSSIMFVKFRSRVHAHIICNQNSDTNSDHNNKELAVLSYINCISFKIYHCYSTKIYYNNNIIIVSESDINFMDVIHKIYIVYES